MVAEIPKVFVIRFKQDDHFYDPKRIKYSYLRLTNSEKNVYWDRSDVRTEAAEFNDRASALVALTVYFHLQSMTLVEPRGGWLDPYTEVEVVREDSFNPDHQS